MRYTLPPIADLPSIPFDTVIDVRSPSEFAEDHMPGAINLPVLSDKERAAVGTMYVQDSPFKARKIGAALVARNAAGHLEHALIGKDGGWKPLVYCWRGGQRSGSFTTILRQVGWRAEVVEGGYKAYRKLVKQALYDEAFAPKVVLLDGNTGTAKTDILVALAARGVQVIDLEGLANHRGSLFGARAGGQPSQKAFESALAQVIAGLDPSRPVVVEAESSKIGRLAVPPQLWAAMRVARRIEIKAPLAARARYLATVYSDIVEDSARLGETLDKLRTYHSAEVIEQWHKLAAAGEMEALATVLMAEHYDSRYGKARGETADVTPLVVSGLGAADIEAAAARIEAMLA
ncbi:MAG: tRNA 2-selenouridine(34) synthase MnmH [Rhodobacteraceae bacterium]|nr:tRNA 2-selenouridine(34) synthase MnmH [Paracoccaceae bacterium]